MQFSEQWLRSFVDPDMTSEALAHLLTMSGLEVEDIQPVAAPFSHVVVGQVIEVAKHPNADRLNVCQVNVGSDTLLTIVCGAPNVRPGLKVPCALAGAQLPPGADGKPFTIKIGQLRGVESHGMLCSARELTLSDDQTGLLELPDDAPIGQDFRDYYVLDDHVFTLKLTPNRADCLSLLGIAREVSALTGAALHPPTHSLVTVNSHETLPVTITTPELCGRFSGRVIRGLNAKAPTPLWMVQRLERSGLRSISALVDISNVVMLECGQPSHVFDLDKVNGGLMVRWGETGESLRLLNGNMVTIDKDAWVGVIADDHGIESLAGIMGGDATAVSLDTCNIYVETAFWWPNAIAGRSRHFNFSTDAGHRFERGVDFAQTVPALERITRLLLDICGTAQTTVGPVDDQITQLPERNPVKVRMARVAKVLGIPIRQDKIADVFTRLGLDFEQDSAGTIFSVTPPSHRFDIEIEEDLIEEIARVIGFDTIPARAPVAAANFVCGSENQRSLFDVRTRLTDLDYQEVINFSFVDAAWEKDFANNTDPVCLKNPIAAQMSVMRSTLLGGLIANVKYNVNRKINRVRVFEMAKVFHRDDAHQPIHQPMHVAGLAYGPNTEEQWGLPTRSVDFFDVKADVEALFAPRSLRFVQPDTEADIPPAMHPGRCALIDIGQERIGVIGELHPRLQQKYELTHAPIMFELKASALQHRDLPAYKPLSKFPAVVRDLAIVVKEHMQAQTFIDCLSAQKQTHACCKTLQTIQLFDQYRGKGLEENEKSLAFRFTFQDTQHTLEDAEVDLAMNHLVTTLTALSDVKLRV